jgi:hypothetical protein
MLRRHGGCGGAAGSGKRTQGRQFFVTQFCSDGRHIPSFGFIRYNEWQHVTGRTAGKKSFALHFRRGDSSTLCKARIVPVRKVLAALASSLARSGTVQPQAGASIHRSPFFRLR